MNEDLHKDFSGEYVFLTSRSGGKGGQHVNKVETKVELRFDISNSKHLSNEEKELLYAKLGNRIDKEGILHIVSDTKRSQLANKKHVVDRFYKLIKDGLTIPKERIPVKLPKAIKEKRLKDKKHVSEKKKLRGKDREFDE